MYKRLLILFICILHLNLNHVRSLQRIESNRINRIRGSVITNLTRTHAYDDDIVTSHLDASVRIRQFYRMIRDVYHKYVLMCVRAEQKISNKICQVLIHDRLELIYELFSIGNIQSDSDHLIVFTDSLL